MPAKHLRPGVFKPVAHIPQKVPAPGVVTPLTRPVLPVVSSLESITVPVRIWTKEGLSSTFHAARTTAKELAPDLGFATFFLAAGGLAWQVNNSTKDSVRAAIRHEQTHGEIKKTNDLLSEYVALEKDILVEQREANRLARENIALRKKETGSSEVSAKMTEDFKKVDVFLNEPDRSSAPVGVSGNFNPKPGDGIMPSMEDTVNDDFWSFDIDLSGLIMYFCLVMLLLHLLNRLKGVYLAKKNGSADDILNAKLKFDKALYSIVIVTPVIVTLCLFGYDLTTNNLDFFSATVINAWVVLFILTIFKWSIEYFAKK